MLLITFFTDNGIPKTGLSPTIRVRDASDGSLVVTDAAMTEIGDGFYKYDFTTYDSSKDYTFRADGGAGLNATDRYVFSTNETDSVNEDLAGKVWDEAVSSHTTSGTFGERVGKKLLTISKYLGLKFVK